MTIKLVGYVCCDHLEGCQKRLKEDDPSIDITYEISDYGERYATAEPYISLREGWERKSYGGTMYHGVKGDFCPTHKELYPKARKANP